MTGIVRGRRRKGVRERTILCVCVYMCLKGEKIREKVEPLVNLHDI